MKKQRDACFSPLEKLIDKGPFPNPRHLSARRLLNAFIISCIFPILGYVYVRVQSVEILDLRSMPAFFSIEIIIIWIIAFLFIYTYLLASMSSKARNIFSEANFLDPEEQDVDAFKKRTIHRILSPSVFLLFPFVILTAVEVVGLIYSQVYLGDVVVTVFLTAILAYANFLNWIGFWMFFMFLRVSSRFGRVTPLKVYPFHQDRFGGLLPIADLSTMALFGIGVLATLVVPLWILFSLPVAVAFVVLTSVAIPIAFFYSMHGVYTALVDKKTKLLGELNRQFSSVSDKITRFLQQKHGETKEVAELNELSQTLSSLDIISQRVRSLQTFPIQSEIIAKVISGAFFPAIILLLRFLPDIL